MSDRRRAAIAASVICLAGLPALAQPGIYPEARRDDAVVDEYHGVKVADPYRWLEDPDAPESRRWIEAQNVITEAYLGAVPQRGAIKERLTALWDYERWGTPFKEGGRYFI